MNETNYHTIIHRPYSDLSAVSLLWSETCSSYAIAEHEADEKVPRTHCHILMLGCRHLKDYYQKKLGKEFPGIDGRKDFRFNTQTQEDKKPITIDGLWYLPKGDINRLKFYNNISEHEVQEAVAKYNPPKSTTTEKPKTDKVNQWQIIKEIRDKLNMSHIDLTSVQYADVSTSQSSFSQNYSHIIDVIIDVLDHHEIKTGMFDIERWFITVVRKDASWKEQIKDKIFSKLRV